MCRILRAIKILGLIVLFMPVVSCNHSKKASKETHGNQITEIKALKELILVDENSFIERLIADQIGNEQKAKTILNWLANNMNWLATDYQQRNVHEILERGGGNCHELAIVTMYFFEKANIKRRKVKEINVHVKSDRRQSDAEKRIAERGNTASVFGYMHNDHVWIEIYDEKNKKWIPVDPTMNIFGTQQWIESRLAFERSETISPYSKDMIFPIGIYAIDSESEEFIDRSQHYIVDEFKGYYEEGFDKKPEWGVWEKQTMVLSRLGLKAFKGSYNLHDSASELEAVLSTFQALKPNRN